MANSTSASLVQTANVVAGNSSSTSSAKSGALTIKPTGGDNWKLVTMFAGFLGLTAVMTAAL